MATNALAKENEITIYNLSDEFKDDFFWNVANQFLYMRVDLSTF